MTREFLKNLGLEDAAIDKILDENMRYIGKDKGSTTTVQTALTATQEKLKTALGKLEESAHNPDMGAGKGFQLCQPWKIRWAQALQPGERRDRRLSLPPPGRWPQRDDGAPGYGPGFRQRAGPGRHQALYAKTGRDMRKRGRMPPLFVCKPVCIF